MGPYCIKGCPTCRVLLVALVGDGVGGGVGGCFKPNFVLVSLGFLLICSAPTGLSISSNYKNESGQTQLPILGSGCLCNTGARVVGV